MQLHTYFLSDPLVSMKQYQQHDNCPVKNSNQEEQKRVFSVACAIQSRHPKEFVHVFRQKPTQWHMAGKNTFLLIFMMLWHPPTFTSFCYLSRSVNGSYCDHHLRTHLHGDALLNMQRSKSSSHNYANKMSRMIKFDLWFNPGMFSCYGNRKKSHSCSQG